MVIDLIAHARCSSMESRASDLAAVTENLRSESPNDRLHAALQISIWLDQKSQMAQDFVDQGCLELVVDCLRTAEDDSPSSSSTPGTAQPTAALLHNFAKEGKKCQDAIALSGGVPLLIDHLHIRSQAAGELDVAAEATAALCLIAVGSEEGRKELLLAGGLPALVRALGEDCPMIIRQHAAGALIGLATERKERQAAILEAGGMKPLLALLDREPDSLTREAQAAALNAATALRRLCDGAAVTASFCQAGGLEVVASRIVNDDPADRQPLRLPMPLGPSTVRAECKHLLGDVYVSSEPMYQERIAQVLEQHNIPIDRITTTPTAADTSLEGKDSMEKGHKVLSCRTSMPAPTTPELSLKLHLKRAMKPNQPKAAPVQPVLQKLVAEQVWDTEHAQQSKRPILSKLLTAMGCAAPQAKTKA